VTLSPRQQQIAALFAEGLTAKGVGRRLGITRKTVWAQAYRASLRLPAGEGTIRQRLSRWAQSNGKEHPS
jgi:DNA-binding NarL/FixJ family response regulator